MGGDYPDPRRPQHIMKPTSNSPATSMRSLERAIDVLEVLDGSRHALRLSEIARRAGLPVATTQRILGVLESRGRVERDASGYRPGVGLIFGAHAYLTSSPLLTATRPVLQDLAAETGLTASLFQRVGWSRVVLARVDGARPLRYELPVGERLPLHLGAGKALAAWMTPEELDEFLGQHDDLARADGTPIDRDEFLNDLKRIRDLGYSQAYGERVPGMASIAAPVIDPEGTAIAAVQVSGHPEDIPQDRVEQLGIEVQRAAFAIARRAF
jgi:DNA-binding IclR family transcriptional regulator